MHLGLQLVALFCANVHALSQIETRSFRAVNFAKPIHGRKLNGSTIKEILVDSESGCQYACLDERRCLSYNFAPAQDREGFRCQLSDSDRFVAVKNFIEQENVFYRGLQSDCESRGSLCGDKGVCIPNYEDDSVTCNCTSGYTGKLCEPRSCAQLLRDGSTSNGVYVINPDGGKAMKVLCDMTTEGGGWTVFQTRKDGSVDFYRGWELYKHGFGDLMGEFWLGNDYLHRLTATDEMKLRIDMEDFEGNVTYAEYTTFKVANESDKYKLTIGGYSGTAGDSLTEVSNSANDMYFTTKDSDNDLRSDSNCAVLYKGAWWYIACHSSNLNGLYHGGPHLESDADGVNWYYFRGHLYSLKRTEMKIRPN